MTLRSRVLGWLDTMRADRPGAYRLFAGVEPTIFASCFALFLRRLFDDLETLPPETRRAWLDTIQAHQDPATGLFVDSANRHRAPDALHDADHLNWQLTTLCLSAVEVLGGEPRYPLVFVRDWPAERVERYLSLLDWANPWNSGNKDMFLGIVLAHQAMRGDASAAAALERWFDWHDRHQNAVGFWGTGARSLVIDGMGGAFHQYLIYKYCRRPIPRLRRIVDRVILLQQRDGLYAPWPSGASCYELDAADILIHAFQADGYRHDDILTVLRRMQPGVLAMQNPDGGFCWGRRHPLTFGGWMETAASLFRHRLWFHTYLSLRGAAAMQVRRSPEIRTGWASRARAWEESNVFDTWFRCLTIAEVSTVLPESPYAGAAWRYLETPGLGWFEARSR